MCFVSHYEISQSIVGATDWSDEKIVEVFELICKGSKGSIYYLIQNFYNDLQFQSSYNIFGFKTLSLYIVLCQGEYKNIFAYDIDDPNTKGISTPMLFV